MKISRKQIRISVFMYPLMSLLFGACDETLETNDKETFIENLASTWEISTEEGAVLLDDKDISEVLVGFEVSISADGDLLTYTTNSDELSVEVLPWPISGQFILNDELTTLTRSDGLVISIVLDEETGQLDMDFEADENTETGRTLGIRGRWKCKYRRR